MSVNGKTVSLKTIVERVYMDFGFNYSLQWSEAAEWAGSILALLKAPVSLQPKFEPIVIAGGKGKLPCDLESITSCAYLPSGSKITPNSAFVFQDAGSYLADVVSIDKINREAVIALSYKEGFNSQNIWNTFPFLIPMRYSTDTMHGAFHNGPWDYNTASDYTYKVHSNNIFPNFSEGMVVMAYNAIPIDSEGYPLIPADEKWQNAVKWEIAHKIAFKLFIQDNIKDRVYEKIERDRDWYIQQAGTHTFSLDEMASLKNSWVRLIPKPHEENNFYKNMQFPEQIYNHPTSLR